MRRLQQPAVYPPLQCPAVANCKSYSSVDCRCTACNQFFGRPTQGACKVGPGVVSHHASTAKAASLRDCDARTSHMLPQLMLLERSLCSALCPTLDVQPRMPTAAAARPAAAASCQTVLVGARR